MKKQSINISFLTADREAWVVNTLKLKMIMKLDNLLTKEGRDNARKLFLVPLFTISEMTKRIQETAPEMETFFYKELTSVIEKSGFGVEIDKT